MTNVSENAILCCHPVTCSPCGSFALCWENSCRGKSLVGGYLREVGAHLTNKRLDPWGDFC